MSKDRQKKYAGEDTVRIEQGNAEPVKMKKIDSSACHMVPASQVALWEKAGYIKV